MSFWILKTSVLYSLLSGVKSEVPHLGIQRLSRQDSEVTISPILSVQLKLFWIWFLYWSAAGPAWVLMQLPTQLIVDINKWSARLIVLDSQAVNCLLTAGCIACSWARLRPSCSKSFVSRLIFCWTESIFSWMKPFQKCLFTKDSILNDTWIMTHNLWITCGSFQARTFTWAVNESLFNSVSMISWRDKAIVHGFKYILVIKLWLQE